MVALAAECNPAQISTTLIAERMGVTQGALFKHFPTKEAIFQAVLDWVAERLLSRVDRAAQKGSSALEALEAMFMAHVEFVVEHPGVPRMLFGELQRAEDTPAKRIVKAVIRRYDERLRRVIERGVAQRELDPGLDVAAAALLFIGAIQGLVMQSLLAGNLRRIRRDAPGAFTIYRRGVERRQ